MCHVHSCLIVFHEIRVPVCISLESDNSIVAYNRNKASRYRRVWSRRWVGTIQVDTKTKRITCEDVRLLSSAAVSHLRVRIPYPLDSARHSHANWPAALPVISLRGLVPIVSLSPANAPIPCPYLSFSSLQIFASFDGFTEFNRVVNRRIGSRYILCEQSHTSC